MKIRELEEQLQGLSAFDKPKILLEQYVTSPHIASHMLHMAETHYGDITNRTVADLGAGCGILSIGACLLEASHVVGFDIDPDALSIFLENCEELEIYPEAVCCDITKYLPGNFKNYFDTVIMNPPFGTKHNAGIDIKFLEIASELAQCTIYSLHKSSTRNYVLQKGNQLGFKAEVLAQLRYDLPQTYKFHKKKTVDIEVDFVRFSRKN